MGDSSQTVETSINRIDNMELKPSPLGSTDIRTEIMNVWN